MTPQYILRKSLCRKAHCYSSHVPGHGYVNRGDGGQSAADRIAEFLGLQEGTPPLIVADKLDDCGRNGEANELRLLAALVDDYDAQRIRSAQCEIDNLGYAPEYAEPGYAEPRKAVLFANWNVFPRGIDTILERYGYAIEWSDEWSTCSDCGRAVRTSPNSYDWTPYYDESGIEYGELVCLDCHRANQHDEDYQGNDDNQDSNDDESDEDIVLYPLDEDKQELSLEGEQSADYKPNHDFHIPF